MRAVTTATGQAYKKRPQANDVEDGADGEDVDPEEAVNYSDTEESESDQESAPQATKILRQLRGASKAEEVERWSEVERKSIVVKTRHNFYKQTKVTSRAQEDQSALPARVLNVYEDTTDEDDFTGEQTGDRERDARATRGAAVGEPGGMGRRGRGSSRGLRRSGR